MLIKLHESKLFTTDTAVRFAQEYRVDKKVWNEIWKRYLAGYDIESLAGYLLYKTGTRITKHTLRRWLRMTEVYCRANHVMLMGVRVVQSEYFGNYEDLVLREIIRGIRYSNVKGSRIMV